MKKLLSIVLIAQSLNLFSQNITQERITEIVSTLADDKMKGRKFGTPENDSAAVYIAKQFAANKLDFCVGDSYLISFEHKGIKGYNVCGIKKGKSEKILGFSGHFDHIGTNNKEGDNINNGADDNASGVSMVIGISDYFKKKKTDFTLMFLGLNAEEGGLIGSRYLADDPRMEKIVNNMTALFNFEMLGTESQWGKNAVYMTGDDFSDFDELINKHAVNGLKVHPDPYVGQKLFYRSDNVNFVKKKVIAHAISTVDMRKAKHYHQVSDDISVIDFENLTNLVNNFIKTIEKLNTKNFAPKYNETVDFNL